nr:MAG TPA: hypothetical protein [Caudoviricetes sp.]
MTHRSSRLRAQSALLSQILYIICDRFFRFFNHIIILIVFLLSH